MRGWVASFLSLGAVTALAAPSDRVMIETNYRLRKGPGKSFGWHRVLRRETRARRIGRNRGPWVKVCIGGVGEECAGGETGWVYQDGVRARPRAETETDAGCAYGKCLPKNERGPKKSIGEVADTIVGGYPLPGKLSPDCQKFISERGLGNWGTLMTKTAEIHARECFYETNIFGSLCPNYLQLPLSKKKAVVAGLFAVMGHYEATCDPRAENGEATSGRGVGMFMMEGELRVRRKAHRDPVLCETSNPNAATKSPAFQAGCTVSIINQSICNNQREPVKLINRQRENYFAGLKGEKKITRTFREMIRRWGVCH